MNELLKGVVGAGFGALAGAGLVTASFLAIEALMPQPADAAQTSLKCNTIEKVSASIID